MTEYEICGKVAVSPLLILNTQLSDIINEAFTKWLRSISLAKTPKFFILDKDAYYLTFNYTDTLETIYGIQDRHVLHIHGKFHRMKHL